jgi:ABC-type nitrate/sulfonate/bicarbonate transport system substrate-binding protein
MTKLRQIALAIGFLFSGFGLAADPVKVTMQLDWIFNAQFAGLYQAEHQGYFEEAGLEVTLVPVDPEQKTVPSVLAAGGLAFGSAESNVLLNAHAEGAPIRIVATMFQDSPIGWMYLESSGIETFSDLAGKRIGIHPDGEKVLGLAARHAGFETADFVLPHVGYDISILINGEVDAMQCYAIDEFVKLELATDGNGGVFMARDYGYSAYSQVVFTTAGTVENHPEVVRKFLMAMRKGWSYALDHKEETVTLILEKYNSTLDRDYQLASLRMIDELVRKDGQPPLAPIDPDVFRKSMQAYRESGLIDQPTDLGELLDPRFNPPVE